MADFKDIWQDPSRVAQEGNPFYYLSIEGGHSWGSPNVLNLKDYDFTATSGRVYLIVKSEHECVFTIRSKKYRAFVASSFDKNLRDAFNMTFNSPTWSIGGYQSSMTFTARGGSMIAIAVDGDAGVWSKSGDVFHRETVARNIQQPNQMAEIGGDGVLLSLTAPYDDWTDGETTSFKFPETDDETQLILDSHKKHENKQIVPTTGEVVDDTSPAFEQNIVLSETEGWFLERTYTNGSDTVKIFKQTITWEYSQFESNSINSYWIFANNVQETQYRFLHKAEEAAELRLSQLGTVTPATGGQDTVEPVKVIKDIVPEVNLPLIGGGIFLMVLVVVFVAMFAKGKGGA